MTKIPENVFVLRVFHLCNIKKFEMLYCFFSPLCNNEVPVMFHICCIAFSLYIVFCNYWDILARGLYPLLVTGGLTVPAAECLTKVYITR
jgi:hypothetical protein